MRLGGYILSSMVEYPGKQSTVIFTLGCNFNCSYCHAYDLIKDTELADIETKMFKEIEAYKSWIDAIVITGGEPTLHRDLPAFVRRLKQFGLPIKLRTNGAYPFVLNELIEDDLIDFISIDYKLPLNQGAYTNLTNAPVKILDIQKSFRLIQDSHVDREYRTTLCPAYVDLKQLKIMASYLEGRDYKPWILQQYRPIDVLDIDQAGQEVYTRSDIDEILTTLQTIYPSIELYGDFLEQGTGNGN